MDSRECICACIGKSPPASFPVLALNSRAVQASTIGARYDNTTSDSGQGLHVGFWFEDTLIQELFVEQFKGLDLPQKANGCYIKDTILRRHNQEVDELCRYP